MQTTLLATLGGKPQLITFLLDLLLARGETIDQVKVIYSAPYPRSQAAFQRLVGEFKGDCYAGRSCHFSGLRLKKDGADLFDVRTPKDVEVVRKGIHSLLSELKGEGQRAHLGYPSSPVWPVYRSVPPGDGRGEAGWMKRSEIVAGGFGKCMRVLIST